MKVLKILGIVSLAALFTNISQTYAQDNPTNSASMKTILTNCNVIDCTGKLPMEEMTVVITDNTITEIRKGSYRQSPGEKNVRVFDLEGAYVLPGLWDMHAHLSDLYPDVNNILAYEPVLPAAIRGGRNAMDALRRGITSLRMTGDRDYIDIAWRDAFNAGVFVGPRIFASGKIVTVTEGNFWKPDWPVAIFVNGPYEIRKAMRENITRGVDFIKIAVGNMEEDEIIEAIKIAHKHGLRVTADAGDIGAALAVKADIDCIEHGDGITDETIQMMAEKGTFYCPTIACNLSAEFITERERKIANLGLEQDPEVVEGRILVAYENERSPSKALSQREILMKAVNAGVKIISGSDSPPHGETGIIEIEQLVFSGMTEMQALIAATRNCADMCGVLDELGTVEEGKLADLIVVSDNPLDNISNLRKLEMVFKDGKPVNLEKDEGQTSFWELYFTKR